MRRSLLAPALTAVLLLSPTTVHAAPGLLDGAAEATSNTPSAAPTEDALRDASPSAAPTGTSRPSLNGSAGDSGLADDADDAPAIAPSTAPAQDAQGVGEQTVPVTASATARVALADDDTVTVLGVSWDAGDSAAPNTVEYRVLGADGVAGAWQEIETLTGDGPDPGTAEAAGARTGTEPIVIADDDEVEVRVDRGSAEVEAITSEVTAADASLPGGPAPTPSAPTFAQTAAASAGLAYTTRAQWGADESLKKCTPDTTASNTAMVVHHTAGATSYSKAQVPGILRGILKYHTQSLGWCDVGYNMLVDRYGTIYEGRSGGVQNAVVGAHASGFNTGTFGVSVMGTYSAPAPQAAVDALVRVGAWQATLWKYDPTSTVTLTSGGGGSAKYGKGVRVTLPRIFGHRDTSSTECPGNGLYGQLGQIRSKAKAGATSYPVTGAIGTFYAKNKAKTGAPTMAQRCGLAKGGCYQKFAKGSVHWTQASGAHFTKAGSGIQNTWKRHSYENGRLGYPTSEEYALKDAPGAYAQNFQGGLAVWSKATSGRTLVGGIGGKWKALGWERSRLKLPVMDEACTLVRKGCYQKFQGGSIHWTSKTGAHETKGAIQKAWGSQKYERGRLGYPTTDEFRSGSLTRQNFEGGYITWSKAQGAKIRYS